MSQCRVCKQDDESPGDRQMIKYGVRHYAHAACALRKWGAAFFDRLTPYQATRFPYLVAVRASVSAALERRAQQYVVASLPQPRRPTE